MTNEQMNELLRWKRQHDEAIEVLRTLGPNDIRESVRQAKRIREAQARIDVILPLPAELRA